MSSYTEYHKANTVAEENVLCKLSFTYPFSSLYVLHFFVWSSYVFLAFIHVVKIFFCDIAAERTGDGAGDGRATPENRVYKLRFPVTMWTK